MPATNCVCQSCALTLLALQCTNLLPWSLCDTQQQLAHVTLDSRAMTRTALLLLLLQCKSVCMGKHQGFRGCPTSPLLLCLLLWWLLQRILRIAFIRLAFRCPLLLLVLLLVLLLPLLLLTTAFGCVSC